jgi:hypothetical protein
MSRRHGGLWSKLQERGCKSAPGRPIGGLALLMRPARAAPGEPFVKVPLRYAPNERRNDLRGLLVRWKHARPPRQKGHQKFERMSENVKRDRITNFVTGTCTLEARDFVPKTLRSHRRRQPRHVVTGLQSNESSARPPKATVQILGTTASNSQPRAITRYPARNHNPRSPLILPARSPGTPRRRACGSPYSALLC